ncbi:HVO_A0114 family putative DNA-binding protein [Methanobrevibacter sp.]|uniref:HVO_A0114 family putative DNA-binding protein n=1 Tax=Methanobrevibacter sp. TaxID=66852 RepID=UPI00262A7AE9|nr:MarR family transcriptional regulator [uncultured Methanobrevibacter sp.]
MIQIKLIREIKGKEYVKEMEEKYTNPKNLKAVYEEHEDMKLQLDYDDWIYFKDHPEETLKQTHILYDYKGLSATDLELLDTIKNSKPNSLTEIAKIMKKDVSNIQRNVNKLKEDGFIELKEGNINNMKTPVFNYDKIEIAI